MLCVGGVSAQINSLAGQSGLDNCKIGCRLESQTSSSFSPVAATADDNWVTLIPPNNLPLCLLWAKEKYGWPLTWVGLTTVWHCEPAGGSVLNPTPGTLGLFPTLVVQHQTKRKFWLANGHPFALHCYHGNSRSGFGISACRQHRSRNGPFLQLFLVHQHCRPLWPDPFL